MARGAEERILEQQKSVLRCPREGETDITPTEGGFCLVSFSVNKGAVRWEKETFLRCARPYCVRNPPFLAKNVQGTSAEQDVRFGNKEKKLLRTLTFPRLYSKKVGMASQGFSFL